MDKNIEKLNSNMQKIVRKIQDIDKRVKGIETLLIEKCDVSKDALDLHQSFEVNNNLKKL